MTAPVLLDLSHTSHTRARTGIQRVALTLYESLGPQAVAITHDRIARGWRELDPWEKAGLSATTTIDAHRGTRWPLRARVRSWLRRFLGARSSLPRATRNLPAAGGLIVPELFSSDTAAALPALLAAVPGPRAALFYDAIPLKYPELTPVRTVARFPGYLRELLLFDGIAAISEDSRQALLDYWHWLGVTDFPPVAALPLGIVPPPAPGARAACVPRKVPVILSVGSVEGRKNHVALLEACERLWAAGVRFELRLIGLAHPQTGRTALERIRALQAAGRPLHYDGPVNDEALEAAYAECAFTVYPSLIEGFGLPVLESLARGKPCVCSARGALGEVARDGGCMMLPSVDAGSLAAAVSGLLNSPTAWAALVVAARGRSFKTVRVYADELFGWLQELPRREIR
jgi:glycosyltransferase involved in cell wall biosynthesis